MKVFLVTISLLFSLASYSQEEELIIFDDTTEIKVISQIDTIPCEHKVNINGIYYEEAFALGINLIDYKLIDYSISEPEIYDETCNRRNRISSIDQKFDTIIIDLEFTRNCCGSSWAQIETIDSLTWNLIIKRNESGCGSCMSSCMFGARLVVINTSGTVPTTFLLNGIAIPISDVVLLRNRTEVEFWENGNIKSETFYVNDVAKFRRNYNSDGKKIGDEHFDK